MVLGAHIREKIELAAKGREDFLGFNNFDIGDEGAVAVAEMLKTNRSINKLYLSNCSITDKGCSALVAAICENPSITDVFLSKNDISTEALESAATVFSASRHRNILQFRTGSDDMPHKLKEQLRINSDVAQQWGAWLLRDEIQLSPDEMRKVESRLSAIKSCAPDAAKRFESGLQLIPTTLKKGEDFAEGLFKPAYSGFAPLDNPRFWQSSEMREAAKDLKLTDEFLAKETPKGSTFMASAAHGLPAKDFMGLFNKQGITFGVKELLDGEGKPSALLEALADKPDGLNALFSAQNWMGNRSGLQRVYKALPASDKPNNYHALLAQCRPASEQGIGR